MALLTSRRIDPVSFFIRRTFFSPRNKKRAENGLDIPLIAGPDDPHPATAAGHAATEKPVRFPETAFRTDTGGSVSGSPAAPRCPAPSFLRFRRVRTRSAVSRRRVPGSTRRKQNGRSLPSATERGDVWQSTGAGTGPAPRRRNYPSFGCSEAPRPPLREKIVPSACRTAPDRFAEALRFFPTCTTTPFPIRRYLRTPQPMPRLLRSPCSLPDTGRPDDTAADFRNAPDTNQLDAPTTLGVPTGTRYSFRCRTSHTDKFVRRPARRSRRKARANRRYHRNQPEHDAPPVGRASRTGTGKRRADRSTAPRRPKPAATNESLHR